MAGIGGAFGDGNVDHGFTYGRVLKLLVGSLNQHWQNYKGTVGFIGDVLFDPSTYLTGGLSAAVKGTGRVGKGLLLLRSWARNT